MSSFFDDLDLVSIDHHPCSEPEEEAKTIVPMPLNGSRRETIQKNSGSRHSTMQRREDSHISGSRPSITSASTQSIDEMTGHGLLSLHHVKEFFYKMLYLS